MNECPGCSQASPPVGQFLSKQLKLPVSAKMWMIKIRLLLELLVEYCPHCGHLKLKVIRVDSI